MEDNFERPILEGPAEKDFQDVPILTKDELMEAFLALKATHRKVLNSRKRSFGTWFWKGKNRAVTIKYMQALGVADECNQIALKKSKAENQGRAAWDITFECDVPWLQKHFGLGNHTARKIFEVLQAMGIWKPIGWGQKKSRIFKVGYRYRNDAGFAVYEWNLSANNKKLVAFYEAEKQ